MDQLEHQVHRIAETEGAVVLAQALVDRTGLEDSRIGFAGDADTRVGLAVLEQDIVVRLILLDKIVLQQKGILFALHHHVLDISYMRYQLPRLGRLMVLAEIAIDPTMQILSLTDIDNLTVCIVILVHARLLRYATNQERYMFVFLFQIDDWTIYDLRFTDD